MCVVSAVMDHYEKRFWPWINPEQPLAPKPAPDNLGSFTMFPQAEVAELRKLIDEFKKAVEAAKTVDRLTKQPDCEDPDKTKLLERVATLEAQVAALTKKQKPKGNRRSAYQPRRLPSR